MDIVSLLERCLPSLLSSNVALRISHRSKITVDILSYFSEPDQRKWQTVFTGQAVVQIKGDRPQSSDLLTDGANAGHSS